MIITQRQVALILIGTTTAITLLALAFYLISGTSPEAVGPTAIAMISFGVLFGLYWYGWEPARYAAAVIIGLLVAASIPTNTEFLAIFIPIVFALALTDTRWVAGIGIALYLILVVRGVLSEGANIYLTAGTFSSFLLALIGTVLGSLALDSARRIAEQRATEAQRQQAMVEQRAYEIEQQSAALNEQNIRQRELLELVSTLETPTVSIADGVLLAPIVGNLDSARAAEITRRLLDSIYRERTRLVILDVAGVALIDTAVARALTDTVRSVKLLGCEIVITGISANVASTLTHIGATLQDLHTAASPQEALEFYRRGTEHV